MGQPEQTPPVVDDQAAKDAAELAALRKERADAAAKEKEENDKAVAADREELAALRKERDASEEKKGRAVKTPVKTETPKTAETPPAGGESKRKAPVSASFFGQRAHGDS